MNILTQEQRRGWGRVLTAKKICALRYLRVVRKWLELSNFHCSVRKLNGISGKRTRGGVGWRGIVAGARVAYQMSR
jgi:hypothetical protein